MAELHVVTRPQLDVRLGRQVVHDERSRAFAAPREVVKPNRAFSHALYDPRPKPNQHVGCCTMVAECVMGNTKGNRVMGEVLDYEMALAGYRIASHNDPWDGGWEPEDTGSSNLAAAKASCQLGIGVRYEWYFGIDHLRSGLPKKPIAVGTWWKWSMFNLDPEGYLDCSGQEYAGGHAWTIIGYDPRDDSYLGVCWWGPNWPTPRANGRFRIRGRDLARLLADDGDAHTTYRA